MAQPDTNVEKQARRHAGPLIGMAAVLLFVLVALVWWLSSAFSGPDPSEPSSTAEVPATSAPAAPASH